MKAKAAILLVTIYLVVFSVLCATATAVGIIPYLFLASPFLVITMVIIVLKDKSQSYPELGADEEWGYADRNKHEFEGLKS